MTRHYAPRGAYQVVVPVKELDHAKSRLDVSPALRRELALAFVLDAVWALERCHLVGDLVVVTRDPEVRDLVVDRGARTTCPSGASSLNADLSWALGDLAPGRATAVLMSDLPAVSTEEITEALTLTHWRGSPCHVEDLHDGGTTMLAARRGQIRPQFGGGSAARHRATGTHSIGHDLVGLRCDVDDKTTLRLAAYIGVGPHTTAVLGRLPATSPWADLAGDSEHHLTKGENR